MTRPTLRTFFAAILLTAGLSHPAAAQRGTTVELVPLARYAFYRDSLPLENGLGLGAEVGLFVNRRLSLEVAGSYAVTTLPDSTAVAATTLTGRFLIHLPLQGRADALFGIGYTQHRYARGLDLTEQGPGGLVGFRFGLGPRLGLRLEGTADYLAADPNSGPRNWNLAAQAGISFYAGPLGPRDSDRDGVPNAEDRCPGTARGQPVDPTGCPLPRDSDGDGVLDGGDRCPGTPAGTRVDMTGCNADLDGDGVANAVDRCPATPAGTAVDQVGCPVNAPFADSDGDGVPDERDRCPGTPPGTQVDALGCPRPAPPPPAPDRTVLHDVTFVTSSASLTAQAEETLREAAATLRSRPGARIEVAGYTDDTGDRAFNEQLSLNRALAVRAFLIEAGVPEDHLTARGYGSADPIASNATAEGRQANRRVELHIVE